MSHVMFALICVIWGTSFILMKQAVPLVGPVGVGSVRELLGAATLWVIWLLMKNRRLPFGKADLLPLLVLAVVGYMAPFTIQPYVIAQVESEAGHGSAFAGMMVSLVPMATIVVSIPMLGIWPRWRQVLGVVGGFGFMVLLFREELVQGVRPIWLALGLCTPLSYAFANTYVKRRFGHVSPLALACAELSLAGVMLVSVFAAMHATGVSLPMPAVADDAMPTWTRAAVCLLLLGVVCTGLAGYMFYTLIRKHGPLYAGMVTYIIPCVAIGIGAATGEEIGAGQLISLFGIFAMVALVQWPARRGDVGEPDGDAVRLDAGAVETASIREGDDGAR